MSHNISFRCSYPIEPGCDAHTPPMMRFNLPGHLIAIPAIQVIHICLSTSVTGIFANKSFLRMSRHGIHMYQKNRLYRSSLLSLLKPLIGYRRRIRNDRRIAPDRVRLVILDAFQVIYGRIPDIKDKYVVQIRGRAFQIVVPGADCEAPDVREVVLGGRRIGQIAQIVAEGAQDEQRHDDDKDGLDKAAIGWDVEHDGTILAYFALRRRKVVHSLGT